MKAHCTKAATLPGSDFHEVRKKADALYDTIRKQTKRRTYVRSAYFKKDKIFIDLFWKHLFDKKNWRDRTRRLKYFPAAIEVIRHSRFDPASEENRNNRSEILHRFAGITIDNELFYVQIKEEKSSGQKFLISVFPE
ncbi:hypothetical protein H6770_02210 [Candidatus Peribacteria bacterium]|nr:hypothetical protein [Candidatus Peribacteria bacterium]